MQSVGTNTGFRPPRLQRAGIRNHQVVHADHRKPVLTYRLQGPWRPCSLSLRQARTRWSHGLCGQADGEGGSAVESGATGGDGPTVGVDEGAGDGEPDTASGGVGDAGGPVEATEDRIGFLGVEAVARVGDRQDSFVLSSRDGDDDGVAKVGVVQGVVEELADYFTDSVSVGAHVDRFRGSDGEVNAGGGETGPCGFADGSGEGDQVAGVGVDASGPLFVCLAAEAEARNYAKGPQTLVWASSEQGLRAAALLRRM